jgi:hypothetical protein
MPAKKTEQDYIAVGKPSGIEWAGRELPAKYSIRTLWRCSKNHIWPTSYASISQGKGCPYCARNAPKIAEDYHKLAQSRGFAWIGGTVISTNTKTMWKCTEGHEWGANYNDIKRGRGCPRCSNRIPKIPSDYFDIAERKGFLIWLGPEVARINIPTNWQCKICGCKWKAPYGNIHTGQGCPNCARVKRAENQRYKPEQYIEIGRSFGFEWLGPEVRRTDEKTQWRCTNNHIFEGTYDKIKQGSGCQACYDIRRAELQRYGPTEYNQLATRQNWTWIGPEAKRTDEKTWWRCENGHEIETTYDTLKQGRGCSKCSQSRGEKRIQNYLESNGYVYEYQKRFDNCRNKRPLPFDFALEVNGIQVLIEYDGELHFAASRFSTGTQKLSETQRNDTIKDNFARGNGFILIRIPYTEFENIEQILEAAILPCTGG